MRKHGQRAVKSRIDLRTAKVFVESTAMKIFFIIAIYCSIVNYAYAGNCRDSNLCCRGKDSSCVVQKASVNAILERLTDKPCYCDHACLKIGDCCSDFKETCSVLDCLVSRWGPWSICDNECGLGAQKRSRMVERPPENGGKHCPQLVQHRTCQGTKCNKRNPMSALTEVALLLPAQMGEMRHINDSNDIRAPLRLRYKDKSAYDTSKEYCVTFTVTHASKACVKKSGFSELAKGANLCVHCETHAFRRFLDWRCEGDGSTKNDESTRWSMLSSPHCHGKWLRTKKTGPECDDSLCHPKPHFIFV